MDFNAGIVDQIRHKVTEGALPSETTCVNCGADTDAVLHCKVECERPWNFGGGFWQHFFLYVLAPIWIWGQLRRDYNNPEVYGQETIVKAPLRVCPDCQSSIRKSQKQRMLRTFLRRVPEYEELLQEYPRARVFISSGRPSYFS
jgi:hypothetical protein